MLNTIIICGLLSSERHDVVLLTEYELGTFSEHSLSLCQDVSCEEWVALLFWAKVDVSCEEWLALLSWATLWTELLWDSNMCPMCRMLPSQLAFFLTFKIELLHCFPVVASTWQSRQCLLLLKYTLMPIRCIVSCTQILTKAEILGMSQAWYLIHI